jgi:hypothetical protein
MDLIAWFDYCKNKANLEKVDNFYIVYRIMGQYFMFYLALILVKYG